MMTTTAAFTDVLTHLSYDQTGDIVQLHFSDYNCSQNNEFLHEKQQQQQAQKKKHISLKEVSL